jgi:hypothetical protein
MLNSVFRKFSNIVNISYSELLSEGSLIYKIEEAYNLDGLGILTVSDIPGFAEKREALLPLATRFAKLPQSVLTKLEVPEMNYGIGWSHGRESFQGVPDYSKGSYYANPEYDDPVKDEKGYHRNIWPQEDFPELERAFKTLGREMIRIGYLLAVRIDRFIEYNCREYPEGIFLHCLKNSH